VLIDRFLEDATEVDVDCISDGETTVIGAIMEHIEEAGIHSGDSACVIPPFSLTPAMQDRIRDAAKKLAKALNVRGLMNMQLAVKGDDLYVIEVNPRASRTAPFVSKAIGVPLPKLAAKIMAGKTLKELGFTEEVIPKHHSVKEAVFPFSKFTGVDIILGPEMKSTGEVMGIDYDLGMAFAKSQMAAGGTLPTKGNVFISVKETDRPNVVRIAKGYADLGFTLYATSGTGSVITEAGIPVNILPKLASGQRPNVIDLMKNKDMALVINTPSGKNPREDEVKIRTAAMQNRIPIMTTLRGADAALRAIKSLQGSEVQVRALQEYHPTSSTNTSTPPTAPAPCVIHASPKSSPTASITSTASATTSGATSSCPITSTSSSPSATANPSPTRSKAGKAFRAVSSTKPASAP
jgi:carbamoyl-phosphate synthase large subunit